MTFDKGPPPGERWEGPGTLPAQPNPEQTTTHTSRRQATGTAKSNGDGRASSRSYIEPPPPGRQSPMWAGVTDADLVQAGRCVECCCIITIQGHADYCSRPPQPIPAPRPTRKAAARHSQAKTTGGTAQPDIAMPKIWHAPDLKPAAPTKWLAANRIPRAAVCLLVGDEGIGKSLFWVWIVAAITTGRPLPMFGIPAREPGCVFLVLTEDDWQSTVLPRLEVAGADISKIGVICAEDDGSGAPIFPRDKDLILYAEPAPVLVVIDAWLDTVAPDLKVRDSQDARRALHPFKDLATQTQAAIMLLGHTNRLASPNPRDLYGATATLRQKCRMTLFAMEDDDGQLVIGPEKANMTRLFTASMFGKDSVQYFVPTPENDGTVPNLVFRAESDMTIREHLAERNAAAREQQPTDALSWLAEFLSAGPQASATVLEVAARRGQSEKVTRAAKVKLGAHAKKRGNTWFWCLPQHADRLSGADDE